LARPITPMIAGVLAVAGAGQARAPAIVESSEEDRARNSPARTASRGAHRSMRSTSRRRPSCELSADHVASLHAFVLRLVPDPANAADIAQQALLRACSDRRRSRIANVDAWLRCIARHLIINHFHTANRYSSVELGDALADSEPVLRTRPDLPIAIRECRERIRGLLDEATGQLCLVHQIALLLSDVYGHCDKHSATLLKMSVPCFKLVLHRARSVLRASRPGPAHPAGWLGVTCYLSTAQLVALRRELLEGFWKA
jgi:DNA-directed RNA polymerase specialized sigma24 family protein